MNSSVIVNESFTSLMDGEIFSALSSPYTALMGGWFYAILILGIASVIQFRTQSIEATGMTLMILSSLGVVANLIPGVTEGVNWNMSAILILLAILGFTLMIWKTVRRGR